MSKINLEAYYSARENWEAALANPELLESILIPTYVFQLNAEEINEFQHLNDAEDESFRLDMGVYNDQVILILVPREEDNEPKTLEEYTYVVLEELNETVQLKQFVSYTTKTIELSNDLSVISETTDTENASLSEPCLTIEDALQEIVAWKYEGLNWINDQAAISQCSNVFRYFIMPYESLVLPNLMVESATLFFGLRQSEDRGVSQATMIVLSHHMPMLELDTEFNYTANTLNFARPCPPH